MTQMQPTLHVECCILAWLHHLTEQTSKPLCPHKHPLQHLPGWCTHCLIPIIRRWWLNCVKYCSQVHRQVAEKTMIHLTVGIVQLYTFTWTGNYISSYVKPESNTKLICYLQRNVNLVWFISVESKLYNSCVTLNCFNLYSHSLVCGKILIN